MRIAFGVDDENGTTRAVAAYLTEHHELLRVAEGAQWPAVGEAVGLAVAGGTADFGVVLCWTGTGTAMAANTVPGIRAALAWEPWIARGARQWNDANVLALSLKRLAPDVAVEVVQAFLAVPAADPSEAANIAGIAELRARHGGPAGA